MMKKLIQVTFLSGLMASVSLAAEPVVETVQPGNSSAGPSNKTAQRPADMLERDAVCTRCHDETENKPILSIYQTPHGNKADVRAPACQSCHGESDAHLKGGGAGSKTRPAPDFVFSEHSKSYPPSPAQARDGQCMACHQSGLRTHWTGSQHQSQDVSCNACHTVHMPKDPVLERFSQPDVCFRCHRAQRSETHQFSVHPILAGKTACSECHNPHGSTGPKMLIKNTVNETCYTCHAEKRGPFLWEHQPVFDDCSNCHTPHGSNNPPLLKQRTPWLCQECHTAGHSNIVNSGADLIDGDATTLNGQQSAANLAPRAQLNARNCLNCHSMIHGSNHPAGALFLR